jgi:hypothetical protein
VPTSGRAWERQRPAPKSASPAAAALQREADAGRARDKQLARELNVTKEEIGDTESQLRKVNADLKSLRNLSLFSLLLPPRQQDIPITKRLTIVQPSQGDPVLQETTDPNVGIPVTTGIATKTDNLMPLLIFMMMGRGIGTSGRGGASGMGNDMMMPLMIVLLMQQQQQQQAASTAAGGTATTTTGGVDNTTMLLLVMMMSGGFS